MFSSSEYLDFEYGLIVGIPLSVGVVIGSRASQIINAITLKRVVIAVLLIAGFWLLSKSIQSAVDDDDE